MEREGNGSLFGAPNYDAPADGAVNKGPLLQAMIQHAMSMPTLGQGQQQALQQFTGNDPTAGMSGMDKLLAGIGSGMSGGALDATSFLSNLGLPGTSYFGQPPEVAAAYEKAIKNKKTIDKALLDTTEGQVGNVVGDTAVTSLANPLRW